MDTEATSFKYTGAFVLLELLVDSVEEELPLEEFSLNATIMFSISWRLVIRFTPFTVY